MVDIIKIDDLPEDANISLAKSRFGYRVVHPTFDDNGKIIWANLLFGGYENLIKLIFIFMIFTLFFFGVNQMMSSCNDMAENPCDYTNLDCSINHMPKEFNAFGSETLKQVPNLSIITNGTLN